MYPDFVLQLCFRLPNGAHFASGFGSIIWFGGHFQIRERAELDPYDVVASPRVAMSSGDACVCVRGVVVLFPCPMRRSLRGPRGGWWGFSAANIHIHTTDDCPDQAGLLAHPTCSDEDGQMV